MRVAYYCQHVLGIGHFHRSMEICKALARHHRTTLILGGPPVDISHAGIEVLTLPGLQMDNDFKNLEPCQPGLSLAEVKAARKERLFAYFRQNRVDIFITELYPFGRKAFRFELDPLLLAIRDGSLPQCSCFCSVRDILVEKTEGREKFERRAVDTLNSFFSAVLVHADPSVITLDRTFGRLDDIGIPIHYTGFVTKADSSGVDLIIREKLGIREEESLIVASIGGGSVGVELLEKVILAFAILSKSVPAHLQLFCGPYCDRLVYQKLKKRAREKITIDLFTDRFPAWLQAAELSISMAGYNTCMNLAQAGIPSLVYPFNQNREQRLRAQRLGSKLPIAILEEPDLHPRTLAEKMAQQLTLPRKRSEIDLHGAQETARRLDTWHREHPNHD